MNDVLFRSYDRFEWWVDRLWRMEFLDDQMFADSDQLAPEFAAASWRDAALYGFPGYTI